MKLLKYIFISALLSVVFTQNVSAQQAVAEFLKFPLDDAQKMGDAYIAPFGKMFGNSLNGGWYQAARPHKLFGFDVTFTAVVATPFADEKEFDFNKLGISNSIVLANSTENISPTITGKGDGIGVVYTKNIGGTDVNVPITLPKGVGLPFTPMPFIQGSIGLPFHSELSLRFFPKVEIPKVGTIFMWGVGVKNEFKEFIPGLKMVPIDLAVMLGYTNFSSEFNVSYKPEAGNYPDGATTASDFDGQKLNLNASGFTARLLVGKTIPILSVYAGLGYSHAVTDFGLKGLYPLSINMQGEPTNLVTANDPLVFAFTHSDFSANLGMRLRFGVIAVNFDYTLGKYPLYSAGFGISFR